MTSRGTEAPRLPEMGVRLYGVLSAAHGDAGSGGAAGAARMVDGVPRGAARRIGTPTGPAAVELLRVRDLVAAVAPAPFADAAPTTTELDAMHTVVSALFAERAILPAPPGAVFRSREAVAAWLELHAAALAEALRYVEDRVEARVRAARPVPGVALPGGSASTPIADVLRALRREAVAVLVLRDAGREEGEPAAGDAPERAGAAALQAAFLVERARWSSFAGAVAREHDACPELRLAVTGPWPPYDFVRLELGA